MIYLYSHILVDVIAIPVDLISALNGGRRYDLIYNLYNTMYTEISMDVHLHTTVSGFSDVGDGKYTCNVVCIQFMTEPDSRGHFLRRFQSQDIVKLCVTRKYL